jgi:peptide/nickel transport system substrate-binding protein
VGTLLLACSPEQQPTDTRAEGGTVVIGLSGEPTSLLPPLVGSDHDQAIVEVLYDRLADIGPALATVGDQGFTPRLASAWQWAGDSMSISFTLDERARWHDGQPVVADDVKRTFELYTNPLVASSQAALLANIDSVSVNPPRTATFWFKRRSPQQFYDAAYHMFIAPAHLLQDADPAQLALAPIGRSPVGTGRFRFVKWNSGDRIEVIADTTNYRGRATLDRVIFRPFTDVGAAVVSLFTGDIDFFSPIPADDLEKAGKTPTLRLVAYPSLKYQLMLMNVRNPASVEEPHPVLGDVAVRRALSMATNRERVVRAVFDSTAGVARGPATGLFIPENATLKELPFDVAAARALLDSAGWLLGAKDSVRTRNGVRLRIEVLVPAGSTNRDRMAVLLQDQLRAVGAELVLQRLEINTLITRLERANFDAFMHGWNMSPGLVGLRQVWTTSSFGGAGNNYGGYRSATYDANIDSALSSFDPVVAQRTLIRALQTIIDDAPGIWLAEDGAIAGMHERIEPGVLSATGWWHGLPSWRIPADKRNDRDRIGLTPAR